MSGVNGMTGMNETFGQIDLKLDWKLLIYGIGNVGRQDDGVGIRLVEKLNQSLTDHPLKENIFLESNYQLSIEDALLISQVDVVLFADATREEDPLAPFSVRRIEPSSELSFTTHAMSIPSVLSLCKELYGRTPRAYCLTIPGYEWEIAEGLSPQADVNLQQAFRSLNAFVTRISQEVSCTNFQ